MHNESPLQTCRAEPCSADVEQPSMARLHNSPGDAPENDIELQRQRARRTAAWAGAIAGLVYVGFILRGGIGR